MAELGAGGGQGDLDQQHELEVYDGDILEQLLYFCETKLRHQPTLLARVNRMIGLFRSQPAHSVPIDASALLAPGTNQDLDDVADFDQMPLEEFVPILVKLAMSKQAMQSADTAVLHNGVRDPRQTRGHLPKRIVSQATKDY